MNTFLLSFALLAQTPDANPPAAIPGWEVGGTNPGSCNAITRLPGRVTFTVNYRRQGDEAHFTIWNPAWRDIADDRTYALTLRFSDATLTVQARGIRTGEQSGSAALTFAQSRNLLERLARGEIELIVEETRSRLSLPNAAAAVARLIECTERERPTSPNPVNLTSYLSHDDYPSEALRRGEQGTVTFRLTIGTNGRATDCTIVQSSGSALLDQTTCRLMRERTRFIPARDANGNLTTDSMEGRVRWALQ